MYLSFALLPYFFRGRDIPVNHTKYYTVSVRLISDDIPRRSEIEIVTSGFVLIFEHLSLNLIFRMFSRQTRVFFAKRCLTKNL